MHPPQQQPRDCHPDHDDRDGPGKAARPYGGGVEQTLGLRARVRKDVRRQQSHGQPDQAGQQDHVIQVSEMLYAL